MDGAPPFVPVALSNSSLVSFLSLGMFCEGVTVFEEVPMDGDPILLEDFLSENAGTLLAIFSAHVVDLPMVDEWAKAKWHNSLARGLGGDAVDATEFLPSSALGPGSTAGEGSGMLV